MVNKRRIKISNFKIYFIKRGGYARQIVIFHQIWSQSVNTFSDRFFFQIGSQSENRFQNGWTDRKKRRVKSGKNNKKNKKINLSHRLCPADTKKKRVKSALN